MTCEQGVSIFLRRTELSEPLSSHAGLSENQVYARNSNIIDIVFRIAHSTEFWRRLLICLRYAMLDDELRRLESFAARFHVSRTR